MKSNRSVWSCRFARMLVVAAFCLFAGRCVVQAQIAGASDKQDQPKGWSAQLESNDVGNPAIHGSTRITDDGLEVVGAGKDVWGLSDQFRFVHEQQTGDFDVAVRVTSLTAPHVYARAGIMARDSLSPDSRHVFFLVFPDNRPRHANTSAYEFQYREKAAGDSKGIYPPQDAGAPAFPVHYPHAWLRLKRTGSEFTGFVSTDGKNWKKYGSYSLDLPATVFLGLAVTSHTTEASTTATFKDFRAMKGAD